VNSVNSEYSVYPEIAGDRLDGREFEFGWCRLICQENGDVPDTEVIDLTSDEEDEYVTSSSVIDLSDTDIEDDVVDLLGGPIEIPVVEREESIVPETPPPQEVMERLRTPIVEEDVRAADREVDILVREGRALPEYEDAPDYVDAPLYEE